VVLIPSFQTEEMSRLKKRRINSTTARVMRDFSHHEFRKKLEHISHREGTIIIGCTEEFTTRTCGVCGTLVPKFSGKLFKCTNPECLSTGPRNGLSARNVLIKHFIRPNKSLTGVASNAKKLNSPNQTFARMEGLTGNEQF
jgi:transposase